MKENSRTKKPRSVDLADLRECHRKLEPVRQSVREGMLIADIETKRFLYADPAICRMLGYSAEELTQLAVADIHPRESLEHVLSKFETQSRGEEAVAANIPCLRKDGTVMYVDVHVDPILVEGKQCSLGLFVDITERKKAEEALRESEEKHRRLLQNVHAGVVVHAADTSVLMANKQASVLLGLTIDQMMGKTDIDPAWCFLHEDGSPMPLEEYPVNQVIASQEAVRYLSLGINSPQASDVVWVLVHAFPEMRADGTLHQIVVTFVDITERKRSEEALRKSESCLNAIFAGSPVGMALYDTDSRHILINESLALFHGIPAEDHVGKRVSEILPKSGHVVEKLIRRIFDTGDPILELEMSGEDGTHSGELSRFLASYFPVFGDQGKPEAVGAVVVDITDRKRAEKALRRSELELTAINENAPLAILLVDYERRIVKMNALAVSMSRRSLEEASGHLIGDALRCVHALDDPKGCGFGPSCGTCTIRGTILDTFKLVKPFHRIEAKISRDSSDGKFEEYYLISTTPLRVMGQELVLVCLEDITERKQAENLLGIAFDELKSRQTALEEKNAAIKQILAHIQDEKDDSLRLIRGSIDSIVMPILARLEQSATDYDTKSELSRIRTHLSELVSPLVGHFRAADYDLTPRQIEICSMIQEGMSSKDIASHLNISEQTVVKHRKNIRKKLGIGNEQVSLSSYLSTLSDNGTVS